MTSEHTLPGKQAPCLFPSEMDSASRQVNLIP